MGGYNYMTDSTTMNIAYQNYYYNEYHEGILEIAKTFFNGLLDQLVDKTWLQYSNKKASSEVTLLFQDILLLLM